MPFLELFDETLDINSTENYELSFQVSQDGVSFCLLDSVRSKFVMLRTYGADENKYFNTEKISEIILNDDFLTRHYKKINCVMPSAKFTLVPSPLFDPGKKDEYFEFNHNLEEDRVILSDKVIDPDAYVVYSYPRHINELIRNVYPGLHPHSHIKVLLDHTSPTRKSINGNYIHAHIERDFFDLFIFSEGTLRFCNTFTYRNVSDILYYVMNVFKNLDIKQEETIHLSGMTEKYDDLSSGFSMYIRNIKFSEPAGNFTFSYIFNDTDLHRFINLFNVANCG